MNSKTRWVQAFDHREAGQLLYFKEKFVALDVNPKGLVDALHPVQVEEQPLHASATTE